MGENLETTDNSSVYNKLLIKKIIKKYKACIYCIRRAGKIKKYKTKCR